LGRWRNFNEETKSLEKKEISVPEASGRGCARGGVRNRQLVLEKDQSV
jgi:hypothetical protein